AALRAPAEPRRATLPRAVQAILRERQLQQGRGVPLLARREGQGPAPTEAQETIDLHVLGEKPVHPRLGLHVRARAGGAGNHHRGEGGGGDAEAAPVGSVSTLRHAARRLGVSRVRGPAVRAQRALPPLRGLQGARAAAPEEARQGLSSAEGGSAGSAGAGAGPPPAQGRPEVQRR
ncbi:unnamed protein product, partial [Prorocentrum cordatum]